MKMTVDAEKRTLVIEDDEVFARTFYLDAKTPGKTRVIVLASRCGREAYRELSKWIYENDLADKVIQVSPHDGLSFREVQALSPYDQLLVIQAKPAPRPPMDLSRYEMNPLFPVNLEVSLSTGTARTFTGATIEIQEGDREALGLPPLTPLLEKEFAKNFPVHDTCCVCGVANGSVRLSASHLGYFYCEDHNPDNDKQAR